MSPYNGYVLGRDLHSAARLNLQHYQWKEQIGYLLHPNIPTSLQTPLKVADIGTGTGIWLLELASHLPSLAQLDGFDIDLGQCPPKPWLPTNVSLHTLDVFDPVPEEVVGKYDVIHIQLFVLIVKNNDPVPLLRNVLRMLKPGGYIQWGEFDRDSRHFLASDPSISLKSVHDLYDYIDKWEQSMGAKSWIPNLANIFLDNGLLDTTLHRYVTAPEHRKSYTETSLMTFDEFTRKVLDSRGEGERARELLARAMGDCRRGVAIVLDKVVAVGRKPLGPGT